MGGEGDLLGIVQEIEVWADEDMLYTQRRIRPGEWDTLTSLGFWDTNRSPNFDQTTRPRDSQ